MLIGTGGNIGAAYLAMNATEQLIKGTDSIKLDSDRETALVIKPDDVSN